MKDNNNKNNNKNKNIKKGKDSKSSINGVAVVVLGDIGRSPRMQYHALSIAKADETRNRVSFIGYNESIPHPLVRQQSNITIRPLKPFPAIRNSKLLWPILAVCKVLFQIFQLLYVLLFLVPKPLNTVLVQSPPAIPTTFVLQIVCWLRGAKLIIDWHNLGYTILQLSTRKPVTHPIIKLAKFIERYFGRKAYAHLFVTETMKDELSKDWKLEGQKFVLHDKPAPIFKALEKEERLSFLGHFESKYASSISSETSKFLRLAREGKAAIGISSTSYTPDEDFGILLSALHSYDLKTTPLPGVKVTLPKLLFFITGKGPDQQMYIEVLKKLKLINTNVCMVWLDSEDYPKLLACADVGVSLHKSSSGIDLPMKVVDMFGCCVPALALEFKCIHELVKDNVNGFTFKDYKELEGLFAKTLTDYPNPHHLNRLRQNLIDARPNNTWEIEWETIKPLFLIN